MDIIRETKIDVRVKAGTEWPIYLTVEKESSGMFYIVHRCDSEAHIISSYPSEQEAIEDYDVMVQEVKEEKEFVCPACSSEDFEIDSMDEDSKLMCMALAISERLRDFLLKHEGIDRVYICHRNGEFTVIGPDGPFEDGEVIFTASGVSVIDSIRTRLLSGLTIFELNDSEGG